MAVPDNGSVEPTEARWPLSYQMTTPLSASTSSATATSSTPPSGSETTAPPYWSYKLYRGPEQKQVQVMYSRNKQDSERIAQQFVNEKIVGFDLEWDMWTSTKPDTPLRKRIGLIQIACEDKIALFHVSEHWGATTEELLAPSLRQIIESADIIKVGANIKQSDFAPFVKYFDVQPRNGLELGHLHTLLTYGASEPAKCTASLRKTGLSHHTLTYLGLPLNKDNPARKSNWSGWLSPNQMEYAASDAYAGFMLYHCMNAKRLAMSPRPPPLAYAESYATNTVNDPLNLRMPDGTVVTAHAFLAPPPAPETEDSSTLPSSSSPRSPRGRRRSPKVVEAPLYDRVDASTARQLQNLLEEHRSEAVEEHGFYSAYMVAPNRTLEEMSRKCPQTERELLKITGIAEKKVAMFGEAWLSIICDFVRRRPPGTLLPPPPPASPEAVGNGRAESPVTRPTPTPVPRPRTATSSSTRVNSSRTPGTAHALPRMEAIPPHAPAPPASLRTGLSFTLETTTLTDTGAGCDGRVDDNHHAQSVSLRDSDNTTTSSCGSASASGSPPAHSPLPDSENSRLKRKSDHDHIQRIDSR